MGGTGLVLQGDACRRQNGFEEDNTKLARLLSVLMRGAEGRMARVVSVCVPVINHSSDESVAGQHGNHFNTSGHESINVQNVFWDHINWDVHIFRSFHWCAKIKVLEV